MGGCEEALWCAVRCRYVELWWWCLVAQVLESFKLTRFMRTLPVLMELSCSLGGNISRDVACESSIH
jgi:hypothetical protein